MMIESNTIPNDRNDERPNTRIMMSPPVAVTIGYSERNIDEEERNITLPFSSPVILLNNEKQIFEDNESPPRIPLSQQQQHKKKIVFHEAMDLINVMGRIDLGEGTRKLYDENDKNTTSSVHIDIQDDDDEDSTIDNSHYSGEFTDDSNGANRRRFDFMKGIPPTIVVPNREVLGFLADAPLGVIQAMNWMFSPSSTQLNKQRIMMTKSNINKLSIAEDADVLVDDDVVDDGDNDDDDDFMLLESLQPNVILPKRNTSIVQSILDTVMDVV